jgi:hypothetical protein
MSPAKRTTTGKRASRAATTTDREVSLPSESDQMEAAPAPDDGATAHSDDDVERRIRHRAYEIYCSRNASDGNELDDWLAAEREVRFGHASTEGRAPTLLESLSEDERRDVAR